MSEQKYTKWLSVVVLFLVSLVTIISFVLSYEALWNFAIAGGKPERLAWLWPVIIDLPIVVFSVVALFAVSLGYNPWPFRLVVGLATALTVWFNYSYAISQDVSWQVYVTAPVMYFVSFEVLAWVIKVVSEKSVMVTGIAEISAKLGVLEAEYQSKKDNMESELKRLNRERLAEIEAQIQAKQNELDTLTRHLNQAETTLQKVTSQLEERRRELGSLDTAKLVDIWQTVSHIDPAHLDSDTRRILAAVLRNGGVAQKDIAQWAGVDPKTIGRDLEKCNGLVRKG